MTDAPEVRKHKSARFIWIIALLAGIIVGVVFFTSRDNDTGAQTSLGEAADVSFDDGTQETPRPLDPNASTQGTDDTSAAAAVSTPPGAGGSAGRTTNDPAATGAVGDPVPSPAQPPAQ